MAIIWDEEKMTTGLPEIDAQHKEWMRRFNEFDDAVVSGKGHESILSALDFLKQYTETHFASEEKSMADLNSPAQGENHAAHAEFRGKLAEISSWVKKEGVSSVEVLALKMTLGDWLVNHISTIDVKLRGAGNGS
jgi:hemerythrin